jgi:hypothetical protein
MSLSLKQVKNHLSWRATFICRDPMSGYLRPEGTKNSPETGLGLGGGG